MIRLLVLIQSSFRHRFTIHERHHLKDQSRAAYALAGQCAQLCENNSVLDQHTQSVINSDDTENLWDACRIHELYQKIGSSMNLT